MTPRWTITSDNDGGGIDECFRQWWTVTDGARSFDCTSEADAIWLAATLNAVTHS